MTCMSSVKGHFDGTSVVLDEPAALVIGQAVRILILDSEPASIPVQLPPPSGSWKGKLRILDDGDDVILEHFSEYLP